VDVYIADWEWQPFRAKEVRYVRQGNGEDGRCDPLEAVVETGLLVTYSKGGRR
jgi:hypothetical protein